MASEVTDWHKIVFKNPIYSDELFEAQLFKYWKFPLLNWSKKDMYEEAVRRGFDDILIMRWFATDRSLGVLAEHAVLVASLGAQNGQAITFAPLPIRLAPALYRKELFR